MKNILKRTLHKIAKHIDLECLTMMTSPHPLSSLDLAYSQTQAETLQQMNRALASTPVEAMPEVLVQAPVGTRVRVEVIRRQGTHQGVPVMEVVRQVVVEATEDAVAS